MAEYAESYSARDPKNFTRVAKIISGQVMTEDEVDIFFDPDIGNYHIYRNRLPQAEQKQLSKVVFQALLDPGRTAFQDLERLVDQLDHKHSGWR